MTRITYGIGIFAAIACMASAYADKPYTVKSHQVKQDDDYVYYSDTRSDGTEITRKVRKPAPRVYPQCVTLVATNDLPVQMQYVYEELYADGHVKTNYQYRTKTARERLKIKLPPMPEIEPREPSGKTDALTLAQKRRRLKISKANHYGKVTNKISMSHPDTVVKSEIKGNTIKHTYKSGKVVFSPIKKAFTVRPVCAPTDYNLPFHKSKK